MAARLQWYFSSIGSMNSVQPYCRLAIITMQTMPRTSWPHRVHTEVTAGTLADVVAMLTPIVCGVANIISAGARSLSHPDGSRLPGLELRSHKAVTAAAGCRRGQRCCRIDNGRFASRLPAARLTVERAAVIGRDHGLRSHRGTTCDQGDRPRLRPRGDDAVCTAMGRGRGLPG